MLVTKKYIRVCTNKLSRWCIRDRAEMISTLAGQAAAAAAAAASACVAHDCFFSIWPVWIHTDNHGHQDQGFRPQGVPAIIMPSVSLRTMQLISPRTSWGSERQENNGWRGMRDESPRGRERHPSICGGSRVRCGSDLSACHAQLD